MLTFLGIATIAIGILLITLAVFGSRIIAGAARDPNDRLYKQAQSVLEVQGGEQEMRRRSVMTGLLGAFLICSGLAMAFMLQGVKIHPILSWSLMLMGICAASVCIYFRAVVLGNVHTSNSYLVLDMIRRMALDEERLPRQLLFAAIMGMIVTLAGVGMWFAQKDLF